MLDVVPGMMMCLHRMYRYTYLWDFCYPVYAVASYSVSAATRRLIIRCGRSTDVVEPRRISIYCRTGRNNVSTVPVIYYLRTRAYALARSLSSREIASLRKRERKLWIDVRYWYWYHRDLSTGRPRLEAQATAAQEQRT